MLSRSCFNNSSPSIDDLRSVNRIPSIIKRSTILSGIGQYYPDGLSWFDEENDVRERRIIVSNQLPIRAYRDETASNWRFEYDTDSLVLQLKDGLTTDVDTWYVGCLAADIQPNEQDDVAKTLQKDFKCVPVYLNSVLFNNYYHGFCKHYLWPLFHYMVPLSQSGGQRFDRDQWQDYYRANMVFAERIMDIVITGDECVWIHDYHLMLLPSIMRKKCRKMKIGFFLHSPFPSSELFSTIPVREDIIRCLLCSDLIGFHTFDYARHFLCTCSRLMGVDYESKRGYIALEYYGRTISIKILPVGIHKSQLESVLSCDETVEKVKELKKKYEGKIVMLGVDDMDLFKGIGFKFSAMGMLLESCISLRGKVVLVQILNPPRSRGKDVIDVQSETYVTAKEINDKYGGPGYQAIVIINGPISTAEKAAYYSIADCVVVNPVRDGMNLVPYKYTFCRQSSPVLDKALDLGSQNPKKSVIIVSEFIGCSPSLSGAIRVNPWNIEDVRDAMLSAITMEESEKQLRHEKHYKYISSHDVAYWAKSFEQDLNRACIDHYEKRWWAIGFGLSFKLLALRPDFRKLALEHISIDYKEKNSRLILLDYDGTMMPESSVNKRPSNEVISVLNSLCNDPKNIVFIVSGRGKDPLSKWFAPCEKLGLSAEHGFFTRWHKDLHWETYPLTMDYDWKKIAEPVMQLYTEATDGSHIEHKESAMVWHYEDADSNFGSCQAKELHDHLDDVLANEPVVVKRGNNIVEVKPQGISKGIAVEKLISEMQNMGKSPDFVLCIGDDRSDEDMFASIGRSADGKPSVADTVKVYACTVCKKPSLATFYLDDTSEVVWMLEGLSKLSDVPKSLSQQLDKQTFKVGVRLVL